VCHLPRSASLLAGVFIEVSALYIGPLRGPEKGDQGARLPEITRVLRFPIGIVDDAMKIPRSNDVLIPNWRA
jgi:hypothetical protein